MTEVWDDRAAFLRETRRLYHNEDYWRFLVREVWRIDRAPVRLADFGCGYGWAGAFLLPMLAEGSDYTGVDRSAPLLAEGREVFARLPYAATFIESEGTATPLPDSAFDVTIAHAYLMHLPDARAGLAEMIRVTREGGLVVTVDASHNAVNAMLHVHETDEQEATPLGLWQRLEASQRRRRGTDGNLGMKTPVLMAEAGLKDVEARVSDAVRLSFPPIDTPEKARVLQAILDDGQGGYPADDAALERTVAAFVAAGAGEAESRAELRRQMANDYRRTLATHHAAIAGLMTISYGRVRRG